MKRLSLQVQESFGINDSTKKSDLVLFNDLILHALVNKLSLEDTYKVLSEHFTPQYFIDTSIMERVASVKETILLLDNDKPLALWVRLLPAYREHTEKTDANKLTQVTLPIKIVRDILCYGTNSSVAYKNQISKARMTINSKLPKGTIMTTVTSGDDLITSFVTATTKEDAHRLLVSANHSGLHTLDKLISALEIEEVVPE